MFGNLPLLLTPGSLRSETIPLRPLQPQLLAAFQDSFSQTVEGLAEISILSSHSTFWKPCSSPDFWAIWISKSNDFNPSWKRRCLTRDLGGSDLGIDRPLVRYLRSLRLAQNRRMPRCLNGDYGMLEDSVLGGFGFCFLILLEPSLHTSLWHG